MCNCRSPSRGEKTVLPHPLWALQLHDSVERSGAGDGVHRRGTVSEGIQTSFALNKTRWSSSRLVLMRLHRVSPDQLLKSPGPK